MAFVLNHDNRRCGQPPALSYKGVPYIILLHGKLPNTIKLLPIVSCNASAAIPTQAKASFEELEHFYAQVLGE